MASRAIFTVSAAIFLCGTGGVVAQPMFQHSEQSAQMEDTQAVPDSIKGGAEILPEPPLPELPTAPVLTTEGYPDCREDYQKLEAPFDKADDTNRCMRLIDAYYEETLLPFRTKMIAHQEEIAKIYTEQVGGNGRYRQSTQDRFYADVMKEHAASDTDGENLADYRAAVERYRADRTYLQDRFCFNTGCNGYAKPEYTPPAAVVAEEQKAERKKTRTKKTRTAEQKCKKARKRGRGLGGLLGGVVGSAAGLDGVGTLIASGVSGVLVGEIACQLTKEEQEVAAKATTEVTEKEEVGATAKWESPSRAGVSGSSTVTALNTEPNGSKCLDITDIAIIDGEETRVQKRMCRGSGDEGYSLVA